MSTLAVVREKIQAKLNDTDDKAGSLDTVQYDHAIADVYTTVGAILPLPHLYISGAFTIAANTDTFSLPTAAYTGYLSATQYGGDIRIRLVNRRYFLEKRTVEELDAERDWTQPTQFAWPRRFALWEENTQKVQGRVFPGSAADEPCDLYVSLVADDLRAAADMDAANVRLSRYGETALVYHAAALLAAAMTPKDLDLRRLSPSVIGLWFKEAARLLYKEECRQADTMSIGRVMRWVS